MYVRTCVFPYNMDYIPAWFFSSWSDPQVHVGLSGDDGVILEYELGGEGEGSHGQGWLRDAHEALR